MSNEQQIQQVEISIEAAEKKVNLRDSLYKLLDNDGFKEVVGDGYFKEEASRLVTNKANPGLQDEDSQKFIDNSIIAIGYFQQYLQNIEQMGNMAEKSLEDDKETRQELLGEG